MHDPTIGRAVSGATVLLSTDGSGAIRQSSGTVTAATSLTLSSATGNIGSLSVSAPTLLLSTTGSVDVTNTSTTTLTLTSTGTTFANLSVKTAGALNTNTLVDVTGVLTLQTTANNGDLVLGGGVSAADIRLLAHGSGKIAQSNGSTTGSNSIQLVSVAGAIDNLNTSTPVLIFGTTGSVAITNDSRGNALSATSTGTTFANLSLRNNDEIRTTNQLQAAGILSLATTANDGAIILGGGATGGIVSFTTNGSGSITQNSGKVTGNTITLSSASGDFTSLVVSTGDLTLDTTGNVAIGNAGAGVLRLASSGSTFASLDLSSNSSIVTADPLVSSSSLSLKTTSGNGSIVLGDDLRGTAVSLTADGSGSILQTNGFATGSSSITLRSDSGNIGPVKTSTKILSVGTTGSVVIQNSDSGPLNLSSTGSIFRDIRVSNDSALSISGSLGSNGLINIATLADNGNVLVGGTITSNGSMISLTANGTGTISNAAGANIRSNGGNILITARDITLSADINASGSIGGRIDLNQNGTLTVNSGSAILARSTTTGRGGIIHVNSNNAPLNVMNNGSVSASNLGDNSGIVAFNAGTSKVGVAGTGTLHAGEYVGFGDIDPTTMEVRGGQVITPTSNFAVKQVTVSQSASITNKIIATSSPPTSVSSPPSSVASVAFSFVQPVSMSFELTQPRVVSDLIQTDKTPVLPEIVRDVTNHVPAILQGFISESAPQTGWALFFGTQFDQATLREFGGRGLKIGEQSGGNFLHLKEGIVLTSSDTDLTLQTSEGKVFIPAGSVALVADSGQNVVVYDFVDALSKQIRIEASGKSIALFPGQQLVLTRSGRSNAADLDKSVAIRNQKRHDFGGGISALISEFSIVSALTSQEPCKELVHKKTKPSVQTLAKVLKTAVALQVVNAKRGPYSVPANK